MTVRPAERGCVALIADRVAEARAGRNDKVIARLASGWAVLGDDQFLPGYCVLLADPVVPSLNDLSEPDRLRFLSDMALVGDAILRVTGAERMNYEILGNSEPELHAHIHPRYADEPDEGRRMPVWFYHLQGAAQYSGSQPDRLLEKLRGALQTEA
jgi:diadenosine tetraphosphate (Ap4A) HIT family hydrolase